jgi:hypothetical protein
MVFINYGIYSLLFTYYCSTFYLEILAIINLFFLDFYIVYFNDLLFLYLLFDLKNVYLYL